MVVSGPGSTLFFLIQPIVFVPEHALQIVPDESIAVESDKVILVLRSFSPRELLHSRLVLAESKHELDGGLHLFRRALAGEREAEQISNLVLGQDIACYISAVDGFDPDLSTLGHLGTNVLPKQGSIRA